MICRLIELMDLLEAAQPFVNDCIDVVDGPDGPRANPAMILAGRIAEALAECERLFPDEEEYATSWELFGGVGFPPSGTYSLAHIPSAAP